MNHDAREVTKGYGQGFNPYYNFDKRYGQYKPQIYVDGFATPWESGCSVGDAKLKLNKPINEDGSLTLYAAILLHFAIAQNWTKKEIMEKRLGYKPVKHDRWRSKPNAEGKWTKYDKPGYHYSFGSYFSILSYCGLILWDGKRKEWVTGPRFDAYWNEVIVPAAMSRGWTVDDVWNSFEAKVKELNQKNK